MKVVLIYPRGGDVAQGIPLAFGYLKSNTDADIRLIDCTLENIAPNSIEFVKRVVLANPDVVGAFSWSANFQETLNVFKVVKQINPQTKTILGGPHATVIGKNTIWHKEINFLFRGEAELVFSIFLEEVAKISPEFSRVKGLVYREGEGAWFNDISRIENLDEVKLPDYDFINLAGYIGKGYHYQVKERSAPIWATRGCPYRCTFCAVPSVSGRKLRKHSIEYMMEWIKLLYEKHSIRGFVIIDDNFTFDVNYAKTFCEAIIRLDYKGLEFYCTNGVRMQRGDSELWGLMYRAGWRTLVVAPESGSQGVLDSLQKDLNVSETYSIIKEIRNAGLKVHGFFMIGCPNETPEDLKLTESLILDCKFDDLSLTNFQPMPGTPVYDELIKRGEIPENYLPTFFRNRTYITPTLKDFDMTRFTNNLIMKWKECLSHQ